MSPEQAAGQVDLVGPAADVYSLGATLVTLLAGTPPVSGSRTREILAKVRAGDTAVAGACPADVPPALWAVCGKATAVEPNDRVGRRGRTLPGRRAGLGVRRDDGRPPAPLAPPPRPDGRLWRTDGGGQRAAGGAGFRGVVGVATEPLRQLPAVGRPAPHRRTARRRRSAGRPGVPRAHRRSGDRPAWPAGPARPCRRRAEHDDPGGRRGPPNPCGRRRRTGCRRRLGPAAAGRLALPAGAADRGRTSSPRADRFGRWRRPDSAGRDRAAGLAGADDGPAATAWTAAREKPCGPATMSRTMPTHRVGRGWHHYRRLPN